MKFYLNPIYHFPHTRWLYEHAHTWNKFFSDEKKPPTIFFFPQQSIINGDRLLKLIQKRFTRVFAAKNVCKMAIWSEKLISSFCTPPLKKKKKKGSLNPLSSSQRSAQKIFTWTGVKKRCSETLSKFHMCKFPRQECEKKKKNSIS